MAPITKLTKEEVALLCHEANRAYCLALGDDSQPAWKDAPEWQKASALAGVDLHSSGGEVGPDASHRAWMALKEADGWKYGPVKDAEKKEHPCMVPFSELPVEQQAKDYIFAAIVRTAVGFVEPEKIQHHPVVVKSDVHAAVKYIGARDYHADRLYGTGEWTKGSVKMVPIVIAAKMLRHPDVYADASGEVAEAEVAGEQDATKQDAENDQDQEARDIIASIMSKDALADYVMVNYGQKIPRTLSLDNMKSQAFQLIDQYGAGQ